MLPMRLMEADGEKRPELGRDWGVRGEFESEKVELEVELGLAWTEDLVLRSPLIPTADRITWV